MKGKIIFVRKEARGWTFGSRPPDNWGYISKRIDLIEEGAQL